MNRTKLLWLLISLWTLCFYSCTENNEPEQSLLQNTEDVEIYNTPEDIFRAASSRAPLSDEGLISYDDFIKANNENQTRSSSTSSGVLKAVGYTNMTKQKTGKYMFRDLPKTHPLQNYTYYPYTRYIFGNRVTIPHGATISIPTKTFPTDYPTGWNPNDLSKAGYRYVAISESANGDVYELQTVIDVIEYNVSGQQVGKYYVPFRVGNPATDMYFEYAWQMNDWFE